MATPKPSYYFTLFKKFQVLGHVPEGTDHGSSGSPTGGFDLNDPNAAFGSSNSGVLLPMGASPANSPLWAMLNAKAAGQGSVNIGGTSWLAMPLFDTQSWADFQVNAPAPKLLDTFADWINDGEVKDIPTVVIGAQPGPIKRALDPGVSPFVCSFAGDDGTRPGGVPSDFWNTSLIFLVDPRSGSIATPATLTGGSELYLTAVIGNRGQDGGGRYNTNGVHVEAKGIVMVWNTVFSPGVELPSLSNLDVTANSSLYDQYFLDTGQYDVVGFRLNVQTVYDGIIKELNTDFSDVLDAAGLTADQWVKAQPAHLCAKVVVRQGADNFPNVGDTPINSNRIAQKNLAPFDINLAVADPDPNIVWKNFIVGQPFFLKLGEGEGGNTLILEENFVRGSGIQLYLAIPRRTFARFFGKGGIGKFKGYRVLRYEEVCAGKLGELARPFPKAVILHYLGGENWLKFPGLAEREFLGMSLGIEYSVKRLKPGSVGKVTLVQETLMPRRVPGTLCFELKEVRVGGFTIKVGAYSPFEQLEQMRSDFKTLAKSKSLGKSAKRSKR